MVKCKINTYYYKQICVKWRSLVIILCRFTRWHCSVSGVVINFVSMSTVNWQLRWQGHNMDTTFSSKSSLALLFCFLWSALYQSLVWRPLINACTVKLRKHQVEMCLWNKEVCREGGIVGRRCNGWSCEHEWRQDQSIMTKWVPVMSLVFSHYLPYVPMSRPSSVLVCWWIHL